MSVLHLFGRTEIRRAGTTVLGERDFGGSRPRQIIEILGTARGEPRSKDQLIDQIWDGTPPAEATATLESYVSVLRRRLGPHRSAVVTTSGGYVLDGDALSVDLDQFVGLVSEASRADHPLKQLRQAVALASQPVLASEPYASWAVDARRHYTDRLVEALLRAGRLAMSENLYDEAVSLGRQALTHDELREDAWVLVIAGLQSQGLCMRALRAYDDCRSIYRRELGVEPSDTLRRIQAALLSDAQVGCADISILVRSLVDAVRRANDSNPHAARAVLSTLADELGGLASPPVRVPVAS